MVVNALGPPPKYVARPVPRRTACSSARWSGAKQHAERQVAIGVDVIVAQGTEAGGHCGEISTMVLVPAGGRRRRARRPGARGRRHRRRPADGGGHGARRPGRVDRLDLAPDRRGRHAARGARRTCSPPRRATPSARGSMTGKPARQLRTKWTEAWERPDAPEPLPMPLQGLLYGEAAARFGRVHSKDFAGTPVGPDRRQHRPGPPGPRRRPRHGRGVDRHHPEAHRPDAEGHRLTFGSVMALYSQRSRPKRCPERRAGASASMRANSGSRRSARAVKASRLAGVPSRRW